MGETNIKEAFTHIYDTNVWGSDESASGTGSEMGSTRDIRENLPILFEKYNIKSLLDIGCGDFNWMRTIVGGLDSYLGIDIVCGIVQRDRSLYESDKVKFMCKNLNDISEEVYQDFDAVIIRDVFVHLPLADVAAMIDKLRLGNIQYLFSSTFLGWGTNVDISAGRWRPINLLKEPFNLPHPIETINGYSEPYSITEGVTLTDKALLMWRMPRVSTNKHNVFSNYHAHRQIRMIRPISATDVGTGDGYWGKALSLLCPECAVTGVELSSKWYDHSAPLGVYSTMINDTMVNAINQVSGDLIIFGDVLEHVPKEDAMATLSLATSRFRYVIINTPVGFVAQEHEDTEEIHRCGLTREDMNEFDVMEYQESDGKIEYKVFNCLIRGTYGG